VLYLRSFVSDTITSKIPEDPNPVIPPMLISSEEEKLARALRVVGPGITVGRPGEELPSLGFNRLYVDDHEWQAKVRKLISNASLVVLRIGDTSGLRWELETARELLVPERLVLLVPNDSALAYKPMARDVELCSGLTAPTFKGKVIRNTSSVGLIYFDSEWTGHSVPLSQYTITVKHALDKAFAPVFKQLNVKTGFQTYRLSPFILIAVLIALIALFTYTPSPVPEKALSPELEKRKTDKIIEDLNRMKEELQKSRDHQNNLNSANIFPSPQREQRQPSTHR
jgi:hypothetical protein